MRFGPASVLVLAAIPLVASGSTRNLKGKDGDKEKHHHRHKKVKKEKTAPGAGGGGEPLEEGEGRPWGGRADLPNSHMGLYEEGPVYGLAPPLGEHPYGQYGASPWQSGPSYQPPPALYPQQPNGQPLLPPLPPPPAAAPAPAPEPAAPESGCPPQTFRGEIAPNYYHQAMLGQNDEVHQFYNEGLFPRGIDIDIDIKVLGIDRTDFTIDEELNFNFIGVDVDPYGPPPTSTPPRRPLRSSSIPSGVFPGAASTGSRFAICSSPSPSWRCTGSEVRPRTRWTSPSLLDAPSPPDSCTRTTAGSGTRPADLESSAGGGMRRRGGEEGEE